MNLSQGLLVIGNLNIDRIYSVKALPSEGESTPISIENVVYGGCGGNISSAAAKLGIQVKLSSMIGEDFPTDYIKDLKKDGVDLGPVRISGTKPTPYCLILSAPDGKQMYAFNPGSMGEQGSMEVPVGDALEFVHIATSDPEFSIRAARDLSVTGSSVAIDPGMEIFQRWTKDQLKEILLYCDRFFGNLGEWLHLGKILGWEGEFVEINGLKVPHYLAPFDSLNESVITLGKKGSVIINSEGIFHEDVTESEILEDATGAGDAFRGGFYASLIRGHSSKESLRFGNAMGALSVTSKGPQDYYADWDSISKMVR